jgi:hypothetical protein
VMLQTVAALATFFHRPHCDLHSSHSLFGRCISTASHDWLMIHASVPIVTTGNYGQQAVRIHYSVALVSSGRYFSRHGDCFFALSVRFCHDILSMWHTSNSLMWSNENCCRKAKIDSLLSQFSCGSAKFGDYLHEQPSNRCSSNG